MEEDTVKRKIKQIQISYSNKRELKELSNKEEFRNVIMKNSFESIKEAIKNKWTTVELFDIVNLSIIIKLSSLYFPSALKKISKHFEENEEYEKCAEITNILKNLEK
jgi:hypothetical protein